MKNFRLFQKKIFDMIVLGVPDTYFDHRIHQRDAQGNFSLNLGKTYRSVNFLSRFFQNFHENYLYLPRTAKNTTTIFKQYFVKRLKARQASK